VPLMSAWGAAIYAAEWAEAAFRADKLADEAPLIQLLQHCSTALAVELLALDSPAVPPAAEASAGSERSTEAAASAAASLRPHASAADNQPSAASSHAPAAAGSSDQAADEDSADQPPAAKLDGNVKQPPQQHGKQPPPEWESRWARSVAMALQVQRCLTAALPRRNGAIPVSLQGP
jgi:hypothetical protein